MKIERNALVPYSARQMFELVNSIAEYPRFLPWCHSSKIVKQSAHEVEAALEIVWAGIHKSFTTKNHLHPDEKIEITLVEGPLSHLEGKWQFIAINDHACKIILELEFEFTKSLVDKIFQPIFNKIANTLVDSFCKRAAEIYGDT